MWTSIIENLLEVNRVLAQSFQMRQGILNVDIDHRPRRDGASQSALNLQTESIWYGLPQSYGLCQWRQLSQTILKVISGSGIDDSKILFQCSKELATEDKSGFYCISQIIVNIAALLIDP